MTNIEKVKRILDAGHYVGITYPDWTMCTATSYHNNRVSYFHKESLWTINSSFEDCTIEAIQRIPTPYVAWDKVLVLSNPEPSISSMEKMVWKILTIKSTDSFKYCVYNEDTSDYFYFPAHCLAPAFEEEPTLSGKEAKIVIDGKEYSATLKLI